MVVMESFTSGTNLNNSSYVAAMASLPRSPSGWSGSMSTAESAYSSRMAWTSRILNASNHPFAVAFNSSARDEGGSMFSAGLAQEKRNARARVRSE